MTKTFHSFTKVNLIDSGDLVIREISQRGVHKEKLLHCLVIFLTQNIVVRSVYAT